MPIRAFAVLAATSLFPSAVVAQDAPVRGEPQPWQLWHQEPGSPVMDMMNSFHYMLLWIMVGICLLVSGLLLYVMLRFNAKRNPVPSRTTHNTLIEVLWTVVPVIVLVVIAVPSFRLLYFSDHAPNPEMTIKIVGRQWYWDYQYPDQGDFTFSSIMIPDEEIKPGQRRLLEVDNRLVIPVGTDIRLLLTGGDVIHSFGLPAFGLKDDAVPGRMHETWVRAEKEGIYYGQCSEICGTNHAYMPIAVEVVSKDRFVQWAEEAKRQFAASEEAPVVLTAKE